MIHPQTGQGPVGNFAGQVAIAFYQHKIHNPAQQASGDARRAAGASRNFTAAFGLSAYTQQAGAAGDDLKQLVFGVKL